jgi:hypothetical protein
MKMAKALRKRNFEAIFMRGNKSGDGRQVETKKDKRGRE